MVDNTDEKFDYNLIKYLIAIVETGSMAAASQILGLAPSAVSYGVAKLREEFNDPLFVRAQNGVKPTVLANNIYNRFKPLFIEISESVEQIKNVKQSSFERRRLVMCCNELLEIWATDIFMQSEKLKKKCLLDFRYHSLGAEGRLIKLRNREVDIDIGIGISGDHNIRTEETGTFHYVILSRQDNPRFEKGITKNEFLRQPRFALSPSIYNSSRFSGLDGINLSLSLAPVVCSESMINLIFHALRYDLLVLCPSYILPSMLKTFPCKVVENDFLHNLTYNLLISWHRHNGRDALIDHVVNLLREGMEEHYI